MRYQGAIAFLLTAYFVGCVRPGTTNPDGDNVEQHLISQIGTATGEERQQLIRKLDSISPDIYPLFDRWFLVYADELPFESWDSDGFHPDRSSWPADLQILWASTYSKSDIDNGGLYQFFHNHTGTYAPEFLDFLQRSGNPEAAAVLERAMLHFGPDFPRSQALRQQVLAGPHTGERSEWDPFYKIDGEFYAAFSNALDLPQSICDTWLQSQCGITSLVR